MKENLLGSGVDMIIEILKAIILFFFFVTAAEHAQRRNLYRTIVVSAAMICVTIIMYA